MTGFFLFLFSRSTLSCAVCVLLPSLVLSLGCVLFIQPTCPAIQRQTMCKRCWSLKPAARAAHQLSATELRGTSWGFCSLRLLPDKWGVCFSWQSAAFQKVRKGGFPGGSGSCWCDSELGLRKDRRCCVWAHTTTHTLHVNAYLLRQKKDCLNWVKLSSN